MKRADKEQLVAELKTKLESATALYYTDFTGLNVKRMTELRRTLRKANVEYVVIKNTLALRAVNESGLVGERLRGPTGLVVTKDPVGAAKIITDFAKAQVTKLASMPSREQMLSELGASMQAPMAMFAGAMNSLLQNFAGVVEALRVQREGGTSA
jgi:large subunit ribosomal protein L10